MAFDDERDAFRTFARTFPRDAVLLLDTWDTVQGAHHTVDVARELRGEGIAHRWRPPRLRRPVGLGPKVRAILDEGGFPDVRILASGDLDEHAIAALVADGAPIDGFGVGTRMGTSEDAPSLSVVYKLVADDRGPKLKLSEGKATLPGRKQIHRHEDHDVLCLDGEPCAGRPLLAPVVDSGRRLTPALTRWPSCKPVVRHAVAALPARVRSLEPARPPYEVRVSARLHELVDDLTAVHRVG